MNDPTCDRDPFEVVAESFLERYRAGERPSIEDLAAQHPELAGQIRKLLPALVRVERDLSVDPDPRTVSKSTRSSLGLTPDQDRRLGDYRILREIGRGGMGVVYEAEQLSLGRRVALKVLPRNVVGDRKALERFRREAKAAARLHHTNIVPVFEVGEGDDAAYFAMQFIQGQGLDQVIDELARLRGDGRIRAAGAHEPTEFSVSGGMRRDGIGALAKSLLTGRLATDGASTSRAHLDAAIDPDATEGLDPSLAGAGADPGNDAPDASPVVTPAGVLPGGAPIDTTALSGHRPPYFRGVAQIGRQAAQGLAYAHARGIVHRDIKPSNLLLDHAGVVWIADFGLAKADDEGLTETGDFLGTLRYMAPERFLGQGDGRADIYSLGLTLYELLTLRPAFESSDRLKMIERIRGEDPARPRSLDGRIPRDLETIVLKAIEKDPQSRYQSADAMAEDLRRYLADEPIQARRTTAVEQLARWARRNKGLAASLSAFALLTVAVAIGSTLAAFYFQQQEQAQKQLAGRNRTLAKLAERRSDEIQTNLYWAEMNLASQAAERETGIGRLNELLDHWRPTAGEADRRGWEWYYLRGQGQQALLSWPHRHDGASIGAYALSWSPDARRLASGGEDHVIRLWDGKTGKILATLRGHGGAVSALSWSPDGRQLASGSSDKTLKIWDVDTGREITTLRGHTAPIRPASWSPDGSRLASATSATVEAEVGEIKVWDAATRREISSHTFTSPRSREVVALSWSPDSRQFAAAIRNGTVQIWDAAAARELLTFPRKSLFLSRLNGSPDGERLAGGGDGRAVIIWDPKTGRETARLHGHTSDVIALCWSPDSRYLASGSNDQTIKIWEPKSERVVATLRGHALGVIALDWSRDGRRLASGSRDSSIMVWDMVSGLGAAPLRGHNDAAWAVCWSPDGRRLASSSLDHSVKIWDADTGREIKTLTGHTEWVEGLSWSPDGRRLASGSHDRKVKLWDANTGAEIATLRGHSDMVSAVAFSPDSRRLISVGGDGARKIWDGQTGAEIATAPNVGTIIWAVSGSPDSRRVACAVIDGTIRVMDVETLRDVATLRVAVGTELKAVCWSPDSRRLACGGLDHLVRIWDVGTQKETAILRGHSDWVMGVSWSRDGQRLASASYDGTVKIWDADAGKETATLRGHEDRLNAVSWSPDGLRLASTSWDKTVRIWDATRGFTAERSPALLPILERRLAVDPPNADDLRLRAQIRAGRGDWNQAAADWTDAARILADDAPRWFEAGWWVLGPIATSASSLTEADLEPDLFRPVVTATSGASDASPLDWRAAPASPSGSVDLDALFPDAKSGSARVLVRVYAPREQPVTAQLGCSSGYRFWQNGRLVRESSSARPQDQDDEQFPLTLRAGWNTLLLQVEVGIERDWVSLMLE
jgi:WD40 repeat protein/serine/threonine protein kinase